MRLLFLFSIALVLQACSLSPVQPWERDLLAKPSMSLVPDEIDNALQRIVDKTYGICEGTGKPIPKARLEAQPWARYCVEYARMLEQGLVREQEQSFSGSMEYESGDEAEDEIPLD